MNHPVNDVARFHRKFCHAAPERPMTVAEPGAWKFRRALIYEEFEEVMEAMDQHNMAKTAKELCDLIYVCLGWFVDFGWPFKLWWNKVQQSNMSKRKNPNGGKPIKHSDFIDVNVKEIARYQLTEIGSIQPPVSVGNAFIEGV